MPGTAGKAQRFRFSWAGQKEVAKLARKGEAGAPQGLNSEPPNIWYISPQEGPPSWGRTRRDTADPTKEVADQ